MKPHHLSIVKGPFVYDENLWMIPELLSEVEDLEFLNSISSFILNCHGLNVIDGYQFVVINQLLFDAVGKTNYLCYILVADDEYFQEVPVFFEDKWDKNLNLNEMFLLGWTINKYTEPAIFYGEYPIRVEEDIFFVENKNIINEWGLITEYNVAKKLAHKNSTLDPYDETWRPLAVFIDTYSIRKLKALGLE